MTALAGFVGWPDDVAAGYRARGLWEGVTIGGMLARSAARSPDHVAVVHGDERLTYAALLGRCRDLASRLAGLGLSPAERVLVQLPNGIDFVVTYLALTLIGAIPVMALRAHRHAEVRHFLRASGATAYVVPGRRRRLRLPRDGERDARRVRRAAPRARRRRAGAGPARARHDLAGRAAAHGDGSRAPIREVATMLLSGGTTSMSKLIPRTHDDYVLNARLCGAVAGFDERHGVHGDPAARAQLQPRLAGHARRRSTTAARVVHRAGHVDVGRRVRARRARARDRRSPPSCR